MASSTNHPQQQVYLYEPLSKCRDMDEIVEGSWSFIGGISLQRQPSCAVCQARMHHIVSILVNDDDVTTTTSVYGCNRASCTRTLFDKSKFSLGGGGVYCALRCKQGYKKKNETNDDAEPATAQRQEQHDLLDDNDWDMSDDENDDTTEKDLEAMVKAMEQIMDNNNKQVPIESQTESNRNNANKTDTKNSFDCWTIQAYDFDEDYNSTTNTNDDKIQQMLARYMEQEDDEEILTALGHGKQQQQRATTTCREKDESVGRDEQALNRFMKNVKLYPNHVIRQGSGNPIWSISIPKSKNLVIPSCPKCHKKRNFNFQIMPSLLHLLHVDKHAPTDTATLNDDVKQLHDSGGGMDWGTIAVYSCSCSDSEEEFVIVQDSI